MLQEFLGKTVTIYLGVVSSFTDAIKGEVVDIKDSWLKLRTRRNIELINIDKISRITVRH
jgi:hypothetical protein